MEEKNTTAGDQETSSAVAPAIEAPEESHYLLPPPPNSGEMAEKNTTAGDQEASSAAAAAIEAPEEPHYLLLLPPNPWEMAERNTTAGDQETSSAAAAAIEAPEELHYLLPPLPPNSGVFTVFLDLDGTLIHAWEKEPDHNYDFVLEAPETLYFIQKRPFVDELLDYLGERSFEVVLFTSGLEEYASTIVDELDTNKVISHRLYRDSCTIRDGRTSVKDLSLTGRDLSKVLIVDDHQSSFSLQPENGINVSSFKGDFEDEELRNLIMFFQKTTDFADLREAIKCFAPIGWRQINWALPPATPSDDASPSGTSPPATPSGDASPSGSS